MNIEKGKKYIINTNNVCFFNKGDIVVALESSGESCAPWFIKAETYDILAIKEKNINICDLIEKYYNDIWALCDDDIIEYQG